MTHPHDFADEARRRVSEMTLNEKVALLSGADFWRLKPLDPGGEGVMLSDGPHGLRKQADASDHLGMGAAVPATCFPAAGTLAGAWDPELCEQMGAALGKECAAEGVAVILGPGINIKRNPLCGRNFEYFSEDPLLTGVLAAAFIRGVQSQGVGTSLKHFAANNQESFRMVVDTRVDERTLRELYLPAFERAVTEAQPWTVMCGYNRINGVFCSDHRWLLTTVLREQWGFHGLVVSDWAATNDRVAGVRAGMDLEMPASGGINDRKVAKAVASRRLDMAALDAVVARIVALTLAARSAAAARAAAAAAQQQQAEEERRAAKLALLEANHAFARRAAAQSAVLLKNELPRDGGGAPLLPLARGESLAIVGEFAQKPRFQGAGSSRINAHKVDTPLDALTAKAGGGLVYTRGYDAATARDDTALIMEAVEAAKGARTTVVLVGLPSSYECEGYDREHIRLPAQMDALVEAVAAATPRLVVVLLGGSPMALKWAAKIPCLLLLGLPGQAVGGALADLLYGDAEPSGRLAETWPLRLEDVPSTPHFATHRRQVVYREALSVGYRHFAGRSCLFPFGHGVSYTRFGYSELALTPAATSADALAALTAAEQDSAVQLKLSVSNLGERRGVEVVQVYVRPPAGCSVQRPPLELRCFARLCLEPGESSSIALALPRRAFQVWDVAAAAWRVEPGTYEVAVGASCVDLRLAAPLSVAGSGGGAPILRDLAPYADLDDEALKRLGLTVPAAEGARPYSANTVMEEVGESCCFGRCLYSTVQSIAAKQAAKGCEGLGDAEVAVKMVAESTRAMPLRGYQLFGNGALTDKLLDAIVHLLNGKCCAAIGRICGCLPAPEPADDAEHATPSPKATDQLVEKQVVM